MEVLAIDWKNIDSRFVRDEALERINAPTWVDFLAPENPPDDESFFCKSDCSHPKTVDDFLLKRPSPIRRAPTLLRSSTNSPVSLRERNVRESRPKQLVSSSVTSLSDLKSPQKLRTPSKSPSFRDGSENRNPNNSSVVNSAKAGKLTAECRPEKPLQRQNLVQRPVHKDPNKSGKKPIPSPDPKTPKQVPALKSTLSARNLFAGRDILNQISEFCTELKKLALNGGNRTGAPTKPCTPKQDTKSSNAGKRSVTTSDMAPAVEKQSELSESRILSPKRWIKRRESDNGNKKEDNQRPEWKITGKVNSRSSTEIRSTPPTPQRFPPRPSPLKPPRDSPFKPCLSSNSMDKKEEVHRQLQGGLLPKVEAAYHECNPLMVSPIGGEGPTDAFWFLKPCSLALN